MEGVVLLLTIREMLFASPGQAAPCPGWSVLPSQLVQLSLAVLVAGRVSAHSEQSHHMQHPSYCSASGASQLSASHPCLADSLAGLTLVSACPAARPEGWPRWAPRG